MVQSDSEVVHGEVTARRLRNRGLRERRGRDFEYLAGGELAIQILGEVTRKVEGVARPRE